MTITLMLAWFDEPNELLHDAVTSAAVIADRIVAADGRYEQVPGTRAASPQSQRDTIILAANSVGIEVDFLKPKVWAGQVEKRNALLKAATEGFDTGDYVMPLDADWVLHGSRDAIRNELEVAPYTEEWRVLIHQTLNPARNGNDFPHEWHKNHNGVTKRQALLFRALYDMRLNKTHWDYTGRRLNGRRVGLSGGAKIAGCYPPHSRELQAPFWIEHRAMFRDDKTLNRNKAFCELRDKERELTGAER